MENKIKNIEKHYNVKFVDEWDNECNFYIYEESTADGYSVYVATQNTHQISVDENIYYYDSDLSMAMMEAVQNVDNNKIYVDDMDNYWFEEAIEELTEELTNKIK